MAHAMAGTGPRPDCFAGWAEGPSVHGDEASAPGPDAGLDPGNTSASRQNRCKRGQTHGSGPARDAWVTGGARMNE